MGKKNKLSQNLQREQHNMQRKNEKFVKSRFQKERARREYGVRFVSKFSQHLARSVSQSNRTVLDAKWRSDLQKFNAQLAALGLVVKDVAGDGNCMFRAICDQFEGSPQNHAQYRKTITDYMLAHRDAFEPFFMGEDEHSQSFDEYIARMKRNGSWGGNLELQAASMAYQVNIVVHQLEQPRWEVVNFRHANARAISLSYHTGDHYASVQSIDGRRSVGAITALMPRPASHSASSTSSSTSAFAQAAYNASDITEEEAFLLGLDQADQADEPNWQEKIVMKAVGCTLEEVASVTLSFCPSPHVCCLTCSQTNAVVSQARQALIENFEDTDTAVSYLISLKFSLDESKKVASSSPACVSRQRLTASGGVLSIPSPSLNEPASLESIINASTNEPSNKSSSSSSSSSTSTTVTSNQTSTATTSSSTSSSSAANHDDDNEHVDSIVRKTSTQSKPSNSHDDDDNNNNDDDNDNDGDDDDNDDTENNVNGTKQANGTMPKATTIPTPASNSTSTTVNSATSSSSSKPQATMPNGSEWQVQQRKNKKNKLRTPEELLAKVQSKLPPQHMSRNQKRVAARNEKKATATNKANAPPAAADITEQEIVTTVGPVPDGYVPVQLGALAI